MYILLIIAGLFICIAAVYVLIQEAVSKPEEHMPAYDELAARNGEEAGPSLQSYPFTPDCLPPWESELKTTTHQCKYLTPLYEEDSHLIRSKMEKVLISSGADVPTDSQWDMILSPARSTRVIAGAGSGKSSSLSLRVVLLHKYLSIPIDQITVVTFTRASRADMLKKLTRDFERFGLSLDEKAAKSIVRTFHSLIISQVGMYSSTFFEQIGGGQQVDDADFLGTLNPKQLGHLRNVYEQCYKNVETFKRAIGQLLIEKISTPKISQYNDTESLEKAIAVAEPRDAIVARAIRDAWVEKYKLDSRDGHIIWGDVAVKTSRVGKVWHANGRMKATGTPIILGCGAIKDAAKKALDPDKYPLNDNDKGRNLGFIGNVRLKVLATIGTEKYLYVESETDLNDLYSLADHYSYENGGTFPAFSIKLAGDISSVSVFECLYATGSFIASMGLEVSSAAEKLAGMMDKHGYKIEKCLCLAIADFWPALQGSGCGTYDGLFLDYSDPEILETLREERLLPMRHLLVDEFQDISGQIVNWIKSVHAVLSEQGKEPSIMAVGDDWQSVYGWRGSDPDYIIDFDEHFGESRLVVLNENFRCGETIIRGAEMVVSHLARSAAKKVGLPAGTPNLIAGGIELYTSGDEEVEDLITSILEREASSSIFVLSRTNEGLSPFRKLAKENKNRVTLLTMHRAKGLEADFVIMKGDCCYDSSSPLKNAIYAFAGMKSSFDEAQRDEALRLAYVSITRARNRVFWFCNEVKPDGTFRKMGTDLGVTPGKYAVQYEIEELRVSAIRD